MRMPITTGDEDEERAQKKKCKNVRRYKYMWIMLHKCPICPIICDSHLRQRNFSSMLTAHRESL